MSTVLGGYRLVFDEVNETYIGCGLHLGQLLIILTCPAVLIAIRNQGEVTEACIIGGGILFTLNLIAMTISKLIKGDVSEAEEDTGCFTKQGFLFLFPKREGIVEMIWSLLVTFGYGAGMTYALRPETMIFHRGEDNLGMAIGCSIIMGLTWYSLISGRCPEIAIYRYTEEAFGFGSNHY